MTASEISNVPDRAIVDPPRRKLAPSAAPAIATTFGSAAWAADGGHAMQAMADVLLIESECRTINTVFDLAFRYGEEHGIGAVDSMPLGRRRQEFKAAHDRHRSSATHEQICGPLLAQYRQDFRDWFVAR